jgi:hypothetical protein
MSEMRAIFTPRADGKPRMTDAQRDALWRLCGGYNVPFREDDYYLYPTDRSAPQPGIGNMPGWVEGWVGGCDGRHESGDRRRTIYVGVSPEGQANS